MKVSALIVYGLLFVVCMSTNVEVAGFTIQNPLLRGLIGSVLVMGTGVVLMVIGALMASPLLLFFIKRG